MTTSVPNTPQELMDLNEKKVWKPEEIWELVCELDPGDLQVFGHNVMNRLHQFHRLHVKELVKDETTDPQTLLPWVKDLTIYSGVMDQLDKISD